MSNKLLLTLLSCLFFTCSFGQLPGNHEKIWAFGVYAGIDFNGPTPVAITTSILSHEGCASVCDASGQLLFYTQGNDVWSGNNNLMPNGSDLTGFGAWSTGSTTQTIIVPVPDHPAKFYVFSIMPFELTGYTGRMYRSTVDMTLNGGMGDIAASEKGLLVDTGFSEKLSAVTDPCNNRVWLLAFSRYPKGIKAYEISSGGFNPTPVFTPSGLLSNPDHYLIGTMSVSPNQKKVATCAQHLYVTGIGSLELYDINAGTGVVSNNILIDTGAYYGSCFSPDNTKLYGICTYFNGGPVTYRIYQFDITNPNPNSTKTFIGTVGEYTQIRLAPNGKLYFCPGLGPNVLGAINSPDLSGAACGFVANAIAAAPGTSVIYGLPNVVPWLEAGATTDTVFTSNTYTPCFTIRTSVQAQNQSSDSKYKWNNGDTTQSTNINTAGTYWVRYKLSLCKYQVDTFHVKAPAYHIPTLEAFAGCTNADSAEIQAIPFAGDTYNYTYTWLNSNDQIIRGPLQSSNGDVLQNIPEGLYYLQIKASNDCDTIISIAVPNTNEIFPDVVVSNDSVLCSGLSYLLTASAQQQVTYLWSTGSTASAIPVKNTGDYWVTTYYENCKKTDTISVTFIDCNCRFLIPNAFSPNEDGTNDLFLPVMLPNCLADEYSLRIFNRWGEVVFNSNKPTQGWNGYAHNKPSDAGVYWYYLTYKRSSDHEKIALKGDLLLLR